MSAAYDFLRFDQPTASTVRVLWYLHAFFQEKPWQGGFAYENELRRCHLDYSLDSLQRIDILLDHIRTTHQPTIETFFDDMANQNFLSVVAFYCGEVLGRARRQAAIWIQYEDFIQENPMRADSYPPSMWTDFLIQLNNLDGTSHTFFPLRSLCSRLFGIEPLQSIYASILELITEGTDTTTALPEPPPQSLNFSIRHAISTTPARELPYLQILPPQDLAYNSLYFQIDALGTLYRQGRVVWAAVIQNDPELNTNDTFYPATAELIYDPSGRSNPDTLLQAAKTLYLLQNQDSDEDLDDDEAQTFVRDPNRLLHKAPSFISHMPMQIANVFIWRPHLPDGVLRQKLLPILIDDSTLAVTLLPARYWAHTEHYQHWQNSDQPSELKDETAPAFAALLAEENAFWKHYPEFIRPLAEELPDLGHAAQPYTAEYSDEGKQRVRHYRTAAQSSYPRFSEDLPDNNDVINCAAELAAIHSTAYPTAIEKYAHLRTADFHGILSELNNSTINDSLNTDSLPQAIDMLKRENLNAYHITRFTHSLIKQSEGNHAAAVYLAYFYATGKLLPQSLYESAAWAYQASDGGDWRGTQLLAEILLASPHSAPDLLYDRISNEAYSLPPHSPATQLSSKDIEIQKKLYLNNNDAIKENIRRLLQHAAEQGCEFAPVRIQQLIEAQLLPEHSPAPQYDTIQNWLEYYVQQSLTENIQNNPTTLTNNASTPNTTINTTETEFTNIPIIKHRTFMYWVVWIIVAIVIATIAIIVYLYNIHQINQQDILYIFNILKNKLYLIGHNILHFFKNLLLN